MNLLIIKQMDCTELNQICSQEISNVWSNGREWKASILCSLDKFDSEGQTQEDRRTQDWNSGVLGTGNLSLPSPHMLHTLATFSCSSRSFSLDLSVEKKNYKRISSWKPEPAMPTRDQLSATKGWIFITGRGQSCHKGKLERWHIFLKNNFKFLLLLMFSLVYQKHTEQRHQNWGTYQTLRPDRGSH